MRKIIIRYKGNLNAEDTKALEKELSDKLHMDVTILDNRYGDITIV